MTIRHPKHIIVTTDFSDNAATAYPYALALARHFHAELTLLHVVTVHSDLVDSAAADETSRNYVGTLIHSAQQKLDAEALGSLDGVAVRRVAAQGRTASSGAVTYALDHNADLIVIASHGRRVLGQILLGSVTRGVISEAPCPVLCVKSKASGMLDSETGSLSLSRVLIPTDWSDQCRTALRQAIAFSEGFESSLYLLHVVHFDPPATIFIPPGRPSVFQLDPEMRGRILEHLKEWASGIAGSSRDITMEVLEGSPAKEIAAYADQQDVDLIVISRRCTVSEPSFLGGVALRLLHEAHRPMLVV
ncbi:MAG: universal stress protein [Candidatus Zixiibacteriota bacterium]